MAAYTLQNLNLSYLYTNILFLRGPIKLEDYQEKQISPACIITKF